MVAHLTYWRAHSGLIHQKNNNRMRYLHVQVIISFINRCFRPIFVIFSNFLIFLLPAQREIFCIVKIAFQYTHEFPPLRLRTVRRNKSFNCLYLHGPINHTGGTLYCLFWFYWKGASLKSKSHFFLFQLEKIGFARF